MHQYIHEKMVTFFVSLSLTLKKRSIEKSKYIINLDTLSEKKSKYGRGKKIVDCRLR